VTRDRVTVQPRADDPALRRAIVDRARQRGFSRFALLPEDRIEPRPEEELLIVRAEGIDRGGGAPVLPIARVADEAGLESAVRGTGPGQILVLEWTADRVIPLENAIAARGRAFQVWAVARTPSEVPGSLGALEHGADRVIVGVRTPEEVDHLENLVEGVLPAGLDWFDAPVVSVRAAGVGDRVIVDTTSLLRPSEGLLVGSAAAFLFHVASEAVGSLFSRPRPFRVNAGAAHSYVLMADGSTRYLAELGAGDAVLAVEPRGTSRSVRVGRVKVERRPMVVIRADDAGVERTVFLQEAETVRLSTPVARVATTALRAGVSVTGVRLPAARHLGRAISETIEER
jgi:3-dehydroquinate synthase II